MIHPYIRLAAAAALLIIAKPGAFAKATPAFTKRNPIPVDGDD